MFAWDADDSPGEVKSESDYAGWSYWTLITLMS